MASDQFDGHAAKLFGKLSDCPDKELASNFTKLVQTLGNRRGAELAISRQTGKPARKARRRLAKAGLYQCS